MPSNARKRKSTDAPQGASKKSKPETPAASKDRKTLAPLSQREIDRRAPPDCHARKKDGACRQNCRVCEREKSEWDALNDPDHCFHDLYVCRAKGRDGSPTRDRAGYELDYDKVMGWFQPVTRAQLRPTLPKMRRQQEHFARKAEEEQRMLDDFFEDGAAPRRNAHDFSLVTIEALKEKVEKDTGILWHRVGPAEVRQWREKGFPRAKQGQYRDFSPEKKKRLMQLATGAAFRK